MKNLIFAINLYNILPKKLKNKSLSTPPLQRALNKLAFSNSDKAEALAKSFYQSHTLTLNMKSSKEAMVKKSIKKIESDKSEFPKELYVTNGEVVDYISSLKPRKAPGLDKISNDTLKPLPPHY